MLFYGRALAGMPHAALHYRKEVVRLIAEISMGAGTLAMIGGTVVIVGFLTLATGGVLAIQGYSSLGNIGIEALTGFLAAFINVRISAPIVSLTKATTSAAGIHGLPRRAVMSEGLRSAGCTSRNALTFRLNAGSSSAAAMAADSFVRTGPDR